jgi:hypothetical protein
MKKNLSIKEKADMKALVKRLLLNEGLSQKEVAELVGASERIICQWVKDGGYREQLDNMRREGAKLTKDDTLCAFEAKIRVTRPQHYPLVKELLDYFRSPNLHI